MRHESWRGLDDTALEGLLVERWVYRGLLLGVVFMCAIAATYLGTRGLTGAADRVTVGVVIALAVAAASVAFIMRREDRLMHIELRRRRAPSTPAR